MISKGTTEAYDLVVVGGALSGAATALLAKRRNPELRILIVERSEQFSRRVGESTVEVSSYFLGKILGLADYLAENHLLKQGLRFWFHDSDGTYLDSCSEIGPLYNVRLPSYQVDRAKLDEHLLSLCEKEGIEIWRPAEVKAFQLNPGGFQEVSIKQNAELHHLKSRWLVDASGVAKLVARKSGWVVRNTEHPIGSAWARWRGVKSWDSREIREAYPSYANRVFALRNPATNHLIGKGWWSWWIPLKGGDVSIGIVYDERLVEPPEGDTPGDRLKSMLYKHPLAEILLKDAECLEADVHWRKNIPYQSETMIGDGFALVGDAAAFIDPFYSPGMDWISFTSYGAAELISRERAGEDVSAEIQERNAYLKQSYERWFQAIYKDKYYYMGDWELMKLAFQLDLGLYYYGVVSQPYKYGPDSFMVPPFSGPNTRFPAWLIRTYNRRLAAIAKSRMRRGTFGRKNHGQYLAFQSFGIDKKLVVRILGFLASWGLLELKEGWRSWKPIA
jgi:flavin-dependent dehydrogenase